MGCQNNIVNKILLLGRDINYHWCMTIVIFVNAYQWLPYYDHKTKTGYRLVLLLINILGMQGKDWSPYKALNCCRCYRIFMFFQRRINAYICCKGLITGQAQFFIMVHLILIELKKNGEEEDNETLVHPVFTHPWNVSIQYLPKGFR